MVLTEPTKINEYSNMNDHPVMSKERDISFTEKRQSGKWILMSSKHIKNRSESRQSSTANGQQKIARSDLRPNLLEIISPNDPSKDILEKYSIKTRQGFIPNMKKPN